MSVFAPFLYFLTPSSSPCLDGDERIDRALRDDGIDVVREEARPPELEAAAGSPKDGRAWLERAERVPEQPGSEETSRRRSRVPSQPEDIVEARIS